MPVAAQAAALPACCCHRRQARCAAAPPAARARRSSAALLLSALLATSPGPALAAVSPVVPAPGAAVVAGATRVVDGDTLVVSGTRIRLYGIDAPETKQVCTRPDGSAWTCGVSAGDALRAKVAQAGGNVHCVVLNKDRYGRDVALCDAGGDDIATWMVERGWALAYKAYGGSAFAKPEAVARNAKAGVWASELTPPWEWRAQQRAGSKGGR